MSMNATDSVCSAWATLRATVDLPEPEPPAIPMMNGFISENLVSRHGAPLAFRMRIRTYVAALSLAAACTPPRPLQPVGPLDLVVAATTDVHGYIRGWN